MELTAAILKSVEPGALVTLCSDSEVSVVSRSLHLKRWLRCTRIISPRFLNAAQGARASSRPTSSTVTPRNIPLASSCSMSDAISASAAFAAHSDDNHDHEDQDMDEEDRNEQDRSEFHLEPVMPIRQRL